MKSSVPIRPEASVEIAWGLTHLHSENEEARVYGEYIRKSIDNIQKKVEEAKPRDKKTFNILEISV